MRYSALRILWPSFLVSVAACGVFFSAIDPVELAFVSRYPEATPLAVYSVGFLGFWLIGILASGMTALLSQPAADINRRTREH